MTRTRSNPGFARGAVTVLGVAEADQATTEQARAVIRRQSQHLARLVDDLLDVSRVTSGRVTLVRQPVDLGEIVTRAVGMWRSAGRFDEHQLSVETESVWVNGDETRLEQILSNLVGNALKYTPARGNVSIRVSVRGDGAVLEVGAQALFHAARIEEDGEALLGGVPEFFAGDLEEGALVGLPVRAEELDVIEGFAAGHRGGKVNVEAELVCGEDVCRRVDGSDAGRFAAGGGGNIDFF